jgi:hypothetical protein
MIPQVLNNIIVEIKNADELWNIDSPFIHKLIKDCLSQEAILEDLNGKTIKKIIIVKERVINIVTINNH